MVWQPDIEWLVCLILLAPYDYHIKKQRISGCPSRALLFSNLKTKCTSAPKLSQVVTGPPVSTSISPSPFLASQPPYCCSTSTFHPHLHCTTSPLQSATLCCRAPANNHNSIFLTATHQIPFFHSIQHIHVTNN